jgi:hypothetical protein
MHVIRGCSWTFSWWDTGSSAQTPAGGGALCFNNTVVDSNFILHRDWELDWPGYKRNNIFAKGDTARWMFTNASNHDYTLRAGSPAIDKGVIVPGYVETFNGTSPDLGAYEFGDSRWVAGADWKDQPWVYPPTAVAAMLPLTCRAAVAAPRLRIANGKLLLSGLGKKSWEITLFDMKGSVVAACARTRKSTAVIALPHQATGMYVAKCRSGDIVSFQRVLYKN